MSPFRFSHVYHIWLHVILVLFCLLNYLTGTLDALFLLLNTFVCIYRERQIYLNSLFAYPKRKKTNKEHSAWFEQGIYDDFLNISKYHFLETSKSILFPFYTIFLVTTDFTRDLGMKLGLRKASKRKCHLDD